MRTRSCGTPRRSRRRSTRGGGAKVALDLESANIIANKNLLPTDTSPVKPSGVRLGSQELTRLGMREPQMDEVAGLIARVAVKGEDPKSVARDVAALRKDFGTVQFCFGAGAPAHARARLAGPKGGGSRGPARDCRRES